MAQSRGSGPAAARRTQRWKRPKAVSRDGAEAGTGTEPRTARSPASRRSLGVSHVVVKPVTTTWPPSASAALSFASVAPQASRAPTCAQSTDPDAIQRSAGTSVSSSWTSPHRTRSPRARAAAASTSLRS